MLVLLFITAKVDPAAGGLDAYRQGKFGRAVELLSSALTTMGAAERGGPFEINVREKLVLSLYAAKREDSAVAEYHELKRRFPGFAFDADRISPETLAFFDKHTLVVVAATPEPQATSQPRAVQTAAPTTTAPKHWHWYYLAPLGIGQFLAGSPVRGTLIAVAQVGLIVLDAVAFALLAPQVKANNTVADLNRARPLQLMANIGFFGWIGALALGTLDGAVFEP